MVSRKEAFFGLHFDQHANAHDTELGAEITEEMVDNLLRRVKPDYVQWDCKGHPGYASYPTEVGTPAPGIRQEALAIWRAVTRRHGVRLFIHYSGVIDQVAVAQHPDWAALDADGAPAANGATSTFGPYVDALLIPQLKEVFARYDLDGAWVDGECWGTVPDYSPWAMRAWRAAKGDIEAPRSPEDPHWHEWLEFHREQFERYLTQYLDALHAFKPGVEITSNWMYTGFAPRPVKAPIDFISGDYSAQDSINTARFEARYIANAGMPWDLMAWGFSWWPAEHHHRSHKSAVQLQQEASIVLAQGGGFQIYYTPTRPGWVDSHLVDVMAEVADFCRARQDVSHRTESVPQIALLLSSASFYDKTNAVFRAWEGEHNPLHGTLHALLESGYAVDILAEHQIAGKLDAYPLIVLPETHLLETSFREALLAYVKQGGNLLLIGAEAARLFEGDLGAVLRGQAEEQNAYLFAKGLSGMCSGLWQQVRPQTAEVIGWRYPTFDPRKGGEPAATFNAVGRGRIAAIYGPLGSVHLRYHTPQVREFLRSVVRAVFPDPLVEIVGPPCLDLVVRRKHGRLLVHLTNTAGMQTAQAYTIIDFIPAVGPITIKVKMPDPPTSVCLIPEEADFSYEWTEGLLRVELSTLHIHAVLSIG